MKVRRYAPVLLEEFASEDGTFDVIYSGSYYDTQFTSIEECMAWGIEHGCNGYYDTISDTHYFFNERL